MTPDAQSIVRGEAETGLHPLGAALVTGKLTNLRFIMDALRRRRWLWTGLAILGLTCGIGYHQINSLTYAAHATLYLADPPGVDPSIVSTNDLALLQTAAVGQRAIRILGEPNLNPISLVGNTPGTIVSENVMAITIDGPTPFEAIRRVNAVADAFLAFRSEQYGAQTQAIDAKLNQRIRSLQSQVTALTNEINGTAPIPQAVLANLVSLRAQDLTNTSVLQQTVQQNEAGEFSVSKGSKVITPGIVTAPKKIKTFILDGAAGLVAGLSLGIGAVLIEAFGSYRLWRREDIAAVLGASVDLSVGRVRLPRRWGRRRLLRLARRPTPPIQAIIGYLANMLPNVRSGQKRLLMVAVDQAKVLAVATVSLANQLMAEGKTVVLGDLTEKRTLGHLVGVNREGQYRVGSRGMQQIMLLVAPSMWSEESARFLDPADVTWEKVDVVLLVATVDAAVGAWHLRRWTDRATVVVTAGQSTAQDIIGTAELLRAASVTVTSAILLGAESHDNSIGLSDSHESPLQQRVDALAVPMAIEPNGV